MQALAAQTQALLRRLLLRRCLLGSCIMTRVTRGLQEALRCQQAGTRRTTGPRCWQERRQLLLVLQLAGKGCSPQLMPRRGAS